MDGRYNTENRFILAANVLAVNALVLTVLPLLKCQKVSSALYAVSESVLPSTHPTPVITIKCTLMYLRIRSPEGN